MLNSTNRKKYRKLLRQHFSCAETNTILNGLSKYMQLMMFSNNETTLVQVSALGRPAKKHGNPAFRFHAAFMKKPTIVKADFLLTY